MTQHTVIELQFETSAAGRAPLGDIASSLVAIDELLRDLAAIAAYPDSEFRDIQVAAMTMRSPLTVRLSLTAISPAAVKAFQEICRAIIANRPTAVDDALAHCAPEGHAARITAQEAERMRVHIETLRNAEIPLRAVVLKE